MYSNWNSKLIIIALEHLQQDMAQQLWNYAKNYEFPMFSSVLNANSCIPHVLGFLSQIFKWYGKHLCNFLFPQHVWIWILWKPRAYEVWNYMNKFNIINFLPFPLECHKFSVSCSQNFCQNLPLLKIFHKKIEAW